MLPNIVATKSKLNNPTRPQFTPPTITSTKAIQSMIPFSIITSFDFNLTYDDFHIFKLSDVVNFINTLALGETWNASISITFLKIRKRKKFL